MGVCYSLLWAACYSAIVTASCTGFRRMSQTSRWCVTLCCRLLVIVRSLRLVVLVFEECLEPCTGVLFFAEGCLLLCDRYVWSYWFSKDVSNFVGVCYSLLYAAGLLSDCYVWSYWFPNIVSLFMHIALLVAVFSGCQTGLLGLYKRNFPFSYFYGDLPSI